MTHIVAVEPQHPHALSLLREAALEARALYPELFALDAPLASNGPATPGSIYLLAYNPSGQAVACGALRRIDACCAEVRRMFVTAAARRRGLARAVLQALEDAARRLGYSALRLETGYRQEPAMALYRAAGFAAIPPFGPYIGDPVSRCFEKELAS